MRPRSLDACRPKWLGLLTALVLVAATGAVRWYLADVLEEQAAFLVFLPAVALSAYLGGLWAGLLATLLGAATADLLILRGLYGESSSNAASVIQVFVFVGTGAFVSLLTEKLRRSRCAAADALATAHAAEHEVRRSDERYRTFIRQSSEGIWRAELDTPVSTDWPEDRQIHAFFERGYVAECNDAMARMYGFERAEQLVGTRLRDMLIPDDPANVEYVRRFIRNGYRTVDEESHERDRDGKDKYFLNNFVGVVENGLIVRAWGTQRDVTEQRAAQQRLSLYREIFANSNDGIAIVDTQGRYVEQNAAHRLLTGYTHEDLRGQTPAIHLGEETFAKIGQELAISGSWRGEAVSHVKSGLEVPIELSAFAVRDDDGRPVCYVGIKRDVTARKRAEMRLTAEHAVTRILADAKSLQEAAPRIVEAVRDALHVQVGELWLHDETAGVLRCAEIRAADEARFEPFIRRSRALSMSRGVGMPGRVWQSRAPSWVVDVVRDDNFPRAPEAREVGIHSGMAFPIFAADEFFGAVEFFTDQVLEPDPALVNMMGAIGSEIAQFILRRRAEEQLRRSQADLADFVENATIGIHWVGPDGRILWVNNAELEMLGYARDEYVGRHIADFHADPPTIDRMLRCLSQGQTLREFPARLRCKDGSVRHVLIDSSVRWENDKFVHTRCFTRDVTEQVRAEQALRDSEQSLRLALEAGRMGSWEWDINTGNVRWSPGLEAIHGLAAGTFPGTFEAFVNDVHPDDRERVVRQIQETVAQRKDHHIEYRLKLAGGTERWVEGRGTLYCDDGGRPQRLVGVCLDVTERKLHEGERGRLLEREQQARAEAERANRAKDEFLAVLSHELRTPLTPVLLTVELLEGSPLLPPELRRDLQTIRGNVELEARLIDDLLDLTRIARGKLQLAVQTTDIHELIRSAADICHRSDGVRLVLELSAQRHSVRADPARLQQVFWNLLNNAHKFTPAGGTITVRSQNTPDGQIRVDVIDTGIGIDPQLLPRLFAAFEQGHATSRRFGGLGLGLAISRALMVAQGGRLGAHSEGHGRGATFTVEMPTVRPQVQRSLDALPALGTSGGEVASATPEKGGAGAPGSRPLRILIVEDHEATRFVMTKLLRDMGHCPVSAAGMESALRAVEQQPIDLLISDLGLPDGSGHELMRQIRQKYEVRGIALSGYGMEEDVRRSEQAGFSEHLTKPVDLGRLEAAIRRVTAQPALT